MIHSNYRRPMNRLLLVAACLAPLLMVAPPTDAAEPQAPIIYSDLEAFATSIAAIDGGTEPEQAMADYLSSASPGVHIFVNRFGLSAQSLSQSYARYPKFYHHVAQLRQAIEGRESALRAALSKLQAAAPSGVRQVPIYLLVGDLKAGGNPGLVPTPDGMRPAIGIAIEMMAMSDRVDMSEFPNGPVGLKETDLTYVAVHEMSHVFQMQLQGLDNYRSLYSDPAKATNLAFALREGCADFLTWQASGEVEQTRRAFVQDNEATLWSEFEPIMDEPQAADSGWFGPRLASRPDWPMQVGYGVGMAICEHYYQSAADKSDALQAIYTAHAPEHFAAIVAPYAEKMSETIQP